MSLSLTHLTINSVSTYWDKTQVRWRFEEIWLCHSMKMTFEKLDSNLTSMLCEVVLHGKTSRKKYFRTISTAGASQSVCSPHVLSLLHLPWSGFHVENKQSITVLRSDCVVPLTELKHNLLLDITHDPRLLKQKSCICNKSSKFCLEFLIFEKFHAEYWR